MKYLRLVRSIVHHIRMAYGVWQMDEVVRSGKELYSCVSCGMARSEPCQHWQDSIAKAAGREEQE